jgi:hypothetical protein
MNLKGEKTLNLILQVYKQKTLKKIEGFDNGIIGMEVKSNKLIYSVKRCIKILTIKMPIEEAIDCFYSNIYSDEKHFGKVIFCEDYLIKKPNI